MMVDLSPPQAASPLPGGIILFLTAKHVTLKFNKTLRKNHSTTEPMKADRGWATPR